MPKSAGTSARKPAGVSDEAVRRATGKDWSRWRTLLDAAGARTLDHRGIVALLQPYSLSPWWRQMVAVGYEQATGLRDKHQMPDGYQIGKTRTLSADPERVFDAWRLPSRRARWLADPQVQVRSTKPGEKLSLTWKDGSHVQVLLTLRPGGKCRVCVQHRKLSDAEAGEKMKAYWEEQLEQLEHYLAGTE